MPLLSQNSPLGQKNGTDLVHHGNLALSDCCLWKKSAANDECASERVLPGQYFDSETGFYYNYFREYDPRTGRYVESDPIGLKGGLNSYTYVRNNSLRLVDPSGLIDLKIPGATGETSVHANPGPEATDFRPEHGPPHVHLGSNSGPRVRTDTWEPYSEADELRMTSKQKKFCKNLTDADKTLIKSRAASVFKYGKIMTVLIATPTIGMDSLTATCKQDPFWCAETFPQILDSFGERCDQCQ